MRPTPTAAFAADDNAAMMMAPAGVDEIYVWGKREGRIGVGGHRQRRPGVHAGLLDLIRTDFDTILSDSIYTAALQGR
jgi:hypothetical protein